MAQLQSMGSLQNVPFAHNAPDSEYIEGAFRSGPPYIYNIFLPNTYQ